MSVQAIAWVLDHSPTEGTDRLVLIALANHAGRSPIDGAFEAWPGLATIAREAGLRRPRTAQESLARLEAAGAIERVINGAPDNRTRADRRPNLYRIRIDNGVTSGGTPYLVGDPVGNGANFRERGDASRPDGVTPHDATGCREASPEPFLEPKDEPSSPTRAPTTTAARPRSDDDESRIEEAVAIVASSQLAEREAKLGPVADRRAWLATARRRARIALTERARRELDRRPGLDAQGLAAILARVDRPADAEHVERTVAAQLALAEENDRRMADELAIPFAEPGAAAAGLAEARARLAR